MSQIQLNQGKFGRALTLFVSYSQSDRYKKDVREREERKTYFRSLLNRKFDEAVLLEIIKKLWAAQNFTNKEYLSNKIIKDNGIEHLARSFEVLKSDKATPGMRYEEFIHDIKGMGPSMVTELMCHLDSSRAGIWNNKAREALAWLEVKNLPFGRYQITGEEYDRLNHYLREFGTILSHEGFQNIDLLLVDYLLWEVWDKLASKAEEKIEKPHEPIKSQSRHTEVINKLSDIGIWLGFEVETEKAIAIGARVDVVWQTRIANLGSVSYVFEVQDKGSVDSLIVNLQRAQVNSSVQKLIIVSDAEQIEKIKKEIETMPESFRKDSTYLLDTEVDSTHERLEYVASIIAKLNLVNT